MGYTANEAIRILGILNSYETNLVEKLSFLDNLQGGHPLLTPKFQDISRTISGHLCIFQGQLLSCQTQDMQWPKVFASNTVRRLSIKIVSSLRKE